MSLAKKKKNARLNSNSPNAGGNKSDSDDSDWGSSANERKTKKAKAASLSDDSDNDDDDEMMGDVEKRNGEMQEEVPAPVKHQVKEKVHKAAVADESEPEEGQLTSDDSDSDGSSSDGSSSEFNDGYDENLMGDAEDRARLEALTEKERETEIFKRIERRDMMRTRWEIERKLRLAKRSEKERDRKPKTKKKKKQKQKEKSHKMSSQEKPLFSPPRPTEMTAASPVESPEKKSSDSTEYFDPKERSKERKKNVEMNRTDDKRSNAMAMLKARREGKAKREEEEAKKELQRKQDEEKEEIEGVGGKSSVKLKASDIYSDDSGSESDEKMSDKRSTTSSRSSGSESEDDEK